MGESAPTPPSGGLGACPQEVCFQLYADKTDYYHHWYHAKPMLITSARRDELRRMQSLLYKCIAYMAEHYREWVPKYMPVDDKVMEILDRQSRYPFRAGAYRPDYIISEDGRLLFVEITSRFFGHGIWENYPSEVKARQIIAGHPGASWESRYNEMLTYMRDIIPAGGPLYVLKSSDRTSEIALYKKFYEYYGHEVTIYEAAEVEAFFNNLSTQQLNNSTIFSALNQQDLLSFKMETLQAMIDARMLNDFRTIFLAHDKRFLHLIFVDEFTRQCLTEEEAAFLRQHTIPTCLPPKAEFKIEDSKLKINNSESWDDAITHKDKYILKPYNLGKSVGVYAGVMTDEETWRNTIFNSQLSIFNPNYILQPFIRQRTYPCEWEGKHYDEYVCGMMLCMDDRYFDSGVFRTSSAPVTNKVDHRKMCVIHSDDEDLKRISYVL